MTINVHKGILKEEHTHKIVFLQNFNTYFSTIKAETEFSGFII